jgi:hypothetical protein
MTTACSRLLEINQRQGRLFVCTDLHGNLADFRRMREVFLEGQECHGPCHLLFTGDLIHGPNYTESRWPAYLGSFYEDGSGRLVDEYIELEARHPGHVHCLLGNHEHSHIGGPHTPKFWMDETAFFEEAVGSRRAERYKELFRQFHLVATTPCGVTVTHAAPDVEIEQASDVACVSYDGYEEMSLESIQQTPLLGRLIWSRRCPPHRAREFLRVLSKEGSPQRLVVFGHDIVPEGYEYLSDEQLILSTSFGVENTFKHYLEIDLAGSYESTGDLRARRELKRLYP